MRVYHFSSAKYAVEDIQNQRLKIARINELNDPFELLAADLLDKRDRQAFVKFKNQINEKFGIVCFSGSWESPLLWGHYADKHKGIALGFDVVDEKLNEVNYTTMRPKVEFDQQTRKVINGPKVLDDLIRKNSLNGNTRMNIGCTLILIKQSKSPNYPLLISRKIQFCAMLFLESIALNQYKM